MPILNDATGRTTRVLVVRPYTSDNEGTEGARLALVSVIDDHNGDVLGNINVDAAKLLAALRPSDATPSRSAILQSVIDTLPHLTAGDTSKIADLIEGASA